MKVTTLHPSDSLSSFDLKVGDAVTASLKSGKMISGVIIELGRSRGLVACNLCSGFDGSSVLQEDGDASSSE